MPATHSPKTARWTAPVVAAYHNRPEPTSSQDVYAACDFICSLDSRVTGKRAAHDVNYTGIGVTVSIRDQVMRRWKMSKLIKLLPRHTICDIVGLSRHLRAAGTVRHRKVHSRGSRRRGSLLFPSTAEKKFSRVSRRRAFPLLPALQRRNFRVAQGAAALFSCQHCREEIFAWLKAPRSSSLASTAEKKFSAYIPFMASQSAAPLKVALLSTGQLCI